MRRVITVTFVSLDGVMQAPGGPEEDPTGGFEHGGWTQPLFDDTVGEHVGAALSRPFDLLLGRRTYEIFAAHWPYIEDDRIADQFNAVTKYVATTSEPELTWANSVALRGDAAAQVAELKEGDGPDLLVQGSSVLLQALFAQDLVDELTLLVFPITLGHGKRLFADGTLPRAYELVSTVVSPSGVMIGTYRRGGPVRTGSFVPADPSQLELERRARLRLDG